MSASLTSASVLATSLAIWLGGTCAGAADNPGAGITHGSISHTPALRWEDAFVTGNGRMGAMLFGNPTDETLVANHCRLFVPLGTREIVPDLAQYLPRLRQILRDQGYGEALKFLLGRATGSLLRPS